jgi:uncharacterized protein YndB with AHSA1/START domain
MNFILIVGAVIAALLAFAATKPNTFRLERSITINAPPEKVFALVNDFKEWRQWSPWENVDADLKRDYSGAASGVGAVYAWEGQMTGQGRMEIVESTPAERVSIQLMFIKPWQATNTAEFALTPNAQGGTNAMWAMFGPSPFMSKVMQIFMSMDAMVGKDFEKGLAQLKAAAEK